MKRLWTGAEEEVIRQLYGKRKAAEIAKLLDRPVMSVYHKAHKMGFNLLPRGARSRVADQVRRLNGLGHSDAAIAIMIGEKRYTVGRCRKDLGLPNRGFGPLANSRRSQAKKLAMKENAGHFHRWLELKAKAHQKFAVDNGWPKHLKPRQVQILNVLAAVGLPLTRCEINRLVGVGNEYSLHQNTYRPLVDAGFLAVIQNSRRTRGRAAATYVLGTNALSILEEMAICKNNV